MICNSQKKNTVRNKKDGKNLKSIQRDVMKVKALTHAYKLGKNWEQLIHTHDSYAYTREEKKWKE